MFGILLWLGLRNLISNPDNYIKSLEELNINTLKSLVDREDDRPLDKG